MSLNVGDSNFRPPVIDDSKKLYDDSRRDNRVEAPKKPEEKAPVSKTEFDSAKNKAMAAIENAYTPKSDFPETKSELSNAFTSIKNGFTNLVFTGDVFGSNNRKPEAVASDIKAPTPVVADKQVQVEKTNSGVVLESALSPGTQKTAGDFLDEIINEAQQPKPQNNFKPEIQQNAQPTNFIA